MLKITHARLGKLVADELNLSICNRIALVLGNIIPDCIPSCFYRMHTWDNWYSWFNNERYKLEFYKCRLLYFYKLGFLMHLCADFFTAPHNDRTTTHLLWEWKLAFNFNFDGLCCDTHHIYKLHNDYLESEVNLNNDVLYINKAISSLVIRAGRFSYDKGVSYW